jgi:carbamoyl-phosphate synthase large subunit
MELVARKAVGVPGTPELIGANAEAITTAENRESFKVAMQGIGLDVPPSATARTMDEAMSIITDIGLPVVIRPAFILGGKGTGIATTHADFERLAKAGLDASPISEILIERSIAGWKEYELEVMRDRADNCVVICSIENLDPMGVHTGDSITVAPAQTLTDVEYQAMRDAAFACIRRVGVETGGSNVQFALDPTNGDMVIIEMNPRVSRSSALASKATGFPIAKIAAKLAVGYTLDEIPNDITRKTPASFEPTIDYVVTKVPRWAFEKFPGSPGVLGTSMQSVGEAMAIGRTFPESLQKALRSLEHGRAGLNCDAAEAELDALDDETLISRAAIGTPDRPFQLEAALRRGTTVDTLAERTKVDPWFLDQMLRIVEEREHLAATGLAGMGRRDWKRAKQLGFSDAQLAWLWGTDPASVRAARQVAGVRPTFKTVDTCGAEFEASTPYHYSTYEDEDEITASGRRKVLILGSGPNRIGQGIEFDYCCVHASFALADAGYETVMLNCNPETVSTDYDTSDRLYFEPLTLEDVLAICRLERPEGVVVQFGGQTPLKLAVPLERAGIKLLGTSADAIDRAEDRERFGELIAKLDLRAPRWGVARSAEEAGRVAREIGYPVMVRPSYVLGGRAMERIYDDHGLASYFARAQELGMPLLVDQFLPDAVELDIDVVADRTGKVVVGGVMEHIEEAGIHSGDSACSLPTYSLDRAVVDEVRRQARAVASELGVVGLMNMQVAVAEGRIYILEVNPRGSRTVPFVSKAIGVPLAMVAARLLVGRTLDELGIREIEPSHVSVKEAVFPFAKFEGVDTLLGPEMRSTGEVMGIDSSFAHAFFKAQEAAGNRLPEGGTAFLSLRDADKAAGIAVAEKLHQLGFALVATHGTAASLRAAGLSVRGLNKVTEGRPHCVDAMESAEVDLVVNTVEGRQAIADSHSLRRSALLRHISYFTTMRAAHAAVDAIAARAREELRVAPLQSYHRRPG